MRGSYQSRPQIRLCGYVLHWKTIPSLDTLSPAMYDNPVVYGTGHPPWLGRLEGFKVGMYVPVHDPLRVQASFHAIPVGLVPNMGTPAASGVVNARVDQADSNLHDGDAAAGSDRGAENVRAKAT